MLIPTGRRNEHGQALSRCPDCLEERITNRKDHHCRDISSYSTILVVASQDDWDNLMEALMYGNVGLKRPTRNLARTVHGTYLTKISTPGQAHGYPLSRTLVMELSDGRALRLNAAKYERLMQSLALYRRF